MGPRAWLLGPVWLLEQEADGKVRTSRIVSFPVLRPDQDTVQLHDKRWMTSHGQKKGQVVMIITLIPQGMKPNELCGKMSWIGGQDGRMIWQWVFQGTVS